MLDCILLDFGVTKEWGVIPLFLVMAGEVRVRNEATIQRAWRELEPVLAANGYDLVEVELAQQGGLRILRVYIDRSGGGITLGDCQSVTHLLNPVLDETNLVEGSYCLEVSSPGIDRPVRKPRDFERFVGEPIRARTHAPVEGRKQFRGVLRGYSDGTVAIECEGRVYAIHTENLLKANLDR